MDPMETHMLDVLFLCLGLGAIFALGLYARALSRF